MIKKIRVINKKLATHAIKTNCVYMPKNLKTQLHSNLLGIFALPHKHFGLGINTFADLCYNKLKTALFNYPKKNAGVFQ